MLVSIEAEFNYIQMHFFQFAAAALFHATADLLRELNQKVQFLKKYFENRKKGENSIIQ